MKSISNSVGFALMVAVFGGGASAESREVDGITFAAAPGKVFVPLREVVEVLRLDAEYDDQGRCVVIAGLTIEAGSLRQLIDGTELVGASILEEVGARVEAQSEDGGLDVRRGWRRLRVVAGAKRVVVSLSDQRLRAWQGHRLVMETKISSGKNGRTPTGEFKAGPYKSKMHFSSLYNNAPMPWSVQVNGNIFVHGFSSVPDYPASHGCIRMPLTGRNAARWFYEWVEVGTPVSIRQTAE